MAVKYEVKITGVGKDANTFLDTNASFILMDEGIRPSLKDMVVQHTVGEVNGEIVVGDNVNKDLANGGHCTIVINKEGSMPGQVSVKGKIMPRLRLNNVVKFYTAD